eukprot:PhF_6_TR14101/c0_g1_i1/m.22534
MSAEQQGFHGLGTAIELEMKVNALANVSRANFDKYWGARTAGFIQEWEEKKWRYAVTETEKDKEHPSITIDAGVVKFDYTKIGEIIEKEIVTREEGGKSREAQRPITVRFKGVDYSNIAKVCENLKTNAVVEKLSLNGMKLEADDAKAVADLLEVNKVITAIDLSGNKIETDGVAAITASIMKNPTLVDLDIGANDLGRSAMKVFVPLLASPQCSLKRVLLGANKLGIYGMEELAAGLKTNTSISSLSLFNNNLGNDGLKILAEVFTMDPKNTTLMQVNFGGNKADESEYVAVINDALKFNADVQMLIQLGNLESQARGALNEEADTLFEALTNFENVARKEALEKASQKKAAPAPATAKGKTVPAKPSAKAAPPNAPPKAAPTAPAGSKAVKAASTAPGKRAVSPPKSPTKKK